MLIGSILTILGKIFLDKLRKKDVEKTRKINIIEDLVPKIDEVINILTFEIYMFVEDQRMKMKGIKDLLETEDAEDFYGTTTKDRIKIIKELNSLIPKAMPVLEDFPLLKEGIIELLNLERKIEENHKLGLYRINEIFAKLLKYKEPKDLSKIIEKMKKIPEKIIEEKIRPHRKYITNKINKAIKLINISKYKIIDINYEINNLRKK